MICENCKCKDDCGWYGSYKRIEMEIYTGIGTDNTLGRALIEVMRENNLEVKTTILPISARLIANQAACKFKSRQIDPFIQKLKEQVHQNDTDL